MVSRTRLGVIGRVSALALAASAAPALAQTGPDAAVPDPAGGRTGTSAAPAVPSNSRNGTTAPGSAEQAGGGDIIVTARGRQEALQSAPISVTAFSSRAIDDARIKNVADFIGVTPNVSIVQSQNVGNSFVTIRGISQVRNGESPVAVVTDGVQQVTSRQFTGDLFDVEQIEVLRGPQGALYGRNAIGGAIVIATKQPTNDLRLNSVVSAGNGDDYRSEMSVSGPIVRDRLLFRVAGSVRNFGGLLRNVYLDRTVDPIRDRNVRGQLKAIVTDRFTADLRASYSNTRAGALQYQFQPALFASPTSCFADPTNPFGGPAPDADRVSRRFCATNRGDNLRTIVDASLRLEQRMDWGTITETAAYVDVSERSEGDQFPYTASRGVFGIFDGTQTQYERLNAFQNDLRVASADSARLRWMLGGYYLRTTRFISTTTGQDRGLGITSVFRTPRFTDPRNPTLSFLADDNHNEAYALFGSVSWDLTSALTAEFAYRYDHDHRRQSISPLGTAGVPAGCTVAARGPCDRSTDFSKGQPKFTLTYRPSDRLTLFADYGIGFRSGQYNQAGAAAAAALPGVFDLVRQESAATAEAGFKARLLDGRLRLGGTAFHTRDRDPFYFVFVGAVGAQVLVNIDRIELYGAELEATLTPLSGLDLYANYGFTHSRIERFAFTPADVGKRAPYIPEDGGALGAQYRFAVASGVNLLLRGEVEHHGRQFWDPENSTARSAFQLVNLRGGIESPDDRWAVTGFVRNLTDRRYNAEFVSGGFVQPAEPRVYGVELRSRF